MGTLYLVATPIGNLEDISARALRILGEVKLIAAEDTRQTRKLLTHFNIHTPTTSYYEHNKLSKLDEVLTALAAGDVALVSDAGTPALNDPGYELVRAALQAGHTVSPLPGACAPIAALVASGLPTDSFVYLGYLPRKASERRQFIQSIENLPYTLIFLESPHRLVEALADLESILGDRQMSVARELTKLHEEILRMPISRTCRHFDEHPPRGEFTLVVAGCQPQEAEKWSEPHLMSAIMAALNRDEASASLAARLASESGWERREVYKLVAMIKAETQ
ncbi:MAG: 16S rRNA (cytidine(1402)-2'-O)-methyltransferase [Chloroflexi bacterium GWB2_49_20]|nr:MAG: 16S rRNA (cytidine(1402)-2'-O)-methyltransferase [Chloroflexi bacterium GWB2_49_20]OGN77085.1 MAG: 16S rRNA (cytidine(1402)-2'-O)-methyltransferase [Chloroflexi bacterium GWC2_49_37]OGN83811.1 MAG: 16S rRNA (cytidine(1402)-2'-O)-methyltransferase [Chloroflexi bacterium GWD2_49_16]